MAHSGKEAVRLCERIVRQAFGDVVCRVASTLLNRGRLGAIALARLSGIPRATTLAALLLLMQHNLVLSSGDSLLGSGDEEMYEFDVQECLMRLRWGRILAVTRARLGDAAVEVVRHVMAFGKLRIPDLLDLTGATHDATRSIEINDAATSLVRNQLLYPTRPDLQVLAADQSRRRFDKMKRDKLLDKGQVMLSANELENITKQSEHETTTERQGWRDIAHVLITTESHGKKKSKSKKAGSDTEYSLRPEFSLRLDYDRFNVLIRDEAIVHAAEERWNLGAGVIMRAILSCALKEESTMADDRTHAAVNLNEILDKIPKDKISLIVEGLDGYKASRHVEAVKQYLRVMAEEDAVLGSGNPFLSVDVGSTAYKVEYEQIAVKLRENLLAKLVRQKLGDQAARVLAVVARAGKVSETTVRDYAMIQLKDARHYLAELQKLALVETQEVPKTAAKSRMGLPASSEWHLWQIDLARVYNTLLQSVYKTLGNIVQRRESEIESKAIPLQREQISGDRQALQRKDVDDLDELDDMRRKLDLAELRSEMVVFLLRDMPGFPGQKL